MTINLIVAMDHKGQIGNKGGLPWGKIPIDQNHFRNITIGDDPTRMNVVIMGRLTWESLPKPLKHRVNVVLSENKDFRIPRVLVLNSFAQLRLYIHELDPTFYGDVFIIGGAKLYEEFLPEADRIYLTYVAGDFEGDTLFPGHDAKKWQVVSRTPYAKGCESPYDLEFIIRDRIKPETPSE